jgi:hypothetical protein
MQGARSCENTLSGTIYAVIEPAQDPSHTLLQQQQLEDID